MDAATFAEVMTVDGHVVTFDAGHDQLVIDGAVTVPAAAFMADWNEAMRLANITSPDRAAMWCAQIGAETGSCRWFEELASGAEYNGRADLGNTQPGDGPRFKGRGDLQLTGRSNYRAFSRWAYTLGLTHRPGWFVDHPEQVADLRWRHVSAVFYWTQPHPRSTEPYRFINQAADHRDVSAATWQINGGQNNESGRQQRFDHALQFGPRLLPGAGARKRKSLVRRHPAVRILHPRRRSYLVRPGDTVSAICDRFHVSEPALRRANPGIRNINLIYVGQALTIPKGKP